MFESYISFLNLHLFLDEDDDSMASASVNITIPKLEHNLEQDEKQESIKKTKLKVYLVLTNEWPPFHYKFLLLV